MKFVAVTSCPTGIAHTYMAAESLEQSANLDGFARLFAFIDIIYNQDNKEQNQYQGTSPSDN